MLQSSFQRSTSCCCRCRHYRAESNHGSEMCVLIRIDSDMKKVSLPTKPPVIVDRKLKIGARVLITLLLSTGQSLMQTTAHLTVQSPCRLNKACRDYSAVLQPVCHPTDIHVMLTNRATLLQVILHSLQLHHTTPPKTTQK